MSRVILPLLLFLAPLVSAQTLEEQIATIRTQFASVEIRLDSSKMTRMIDWVDEDQYDGSTPEIVAFFDEKEGRFIKIIETVQGDWRETSTNYYLKDGSVFFVFVKAYSSHEMFTAEELGMTEDELWQSGGEAKTLFAYEYRIYYSSDAVLKMLYKERVFPVDEQGFDLSEIPNKEQNIEEVSYADMESHILKMGFALKDKNQK